ncbi:MAG: SGNH/GDSL hydrolase family protein [Lachnospiraceae bacterium]|nr:SGNH/GDSL hydrolase family protein [Lachnospiraceae bacterium]
MKKYLQKGLLLLFVALLLAAVPVSFASQAAPVEQADGTVFDARYYADTYPDLKAAFGYDAEKLWMHYVNYGRRENRKPCADALAFDPAYYAATNPDVKAALGTDAAKLWNHYRSFGRNEHRKAAPNDKGNAYVYYNGAPVAPVAPTRALRAAFIGDSISSFSGTQPAGYPAYYPHGSLNAADKTWWKRTVSALGMTCAVNASWNGSLLTGKSTDKSGIVGCGDKRISDVVNASPDVVFILMGANDFIYNMPLGNYTPGKGPASAGTGNFAGAYTRLLSELRAKLPHAKLVCLTCLPQYTADGRTMYNKSGYTIEAFNTQIRRIAADFGALVIDTAGAGFSDANSGVYMLSNVNRIHPNAAGAELLANYVIANYR